MSRRTRNEASSQSEGLNLVTLTLPSPTNASPTEQQSKRYRNTASRLPTTSVSTMIASTTSPVSTPSTQLLPSSANSSQSNTSITPTKADGPAFSLRATVQSRQSTIVHSRTNAPVSPETNQVQSQGRSNSSARPEAAVQTELVFGTRQVPDSVLEFLSMYCLAFPPVPTYVPSQSGLLSASAVHSLGSHLSNGPASALDTSSPHLNGPSSSHLAHNLQFLYQNPAPGSMGLVAPNALIAQLSPRPSAMIASPPWSFDELEVLKLAVRIHGTRWLQVHSWGREHGFFARRDPGALEAQWTAMQTGVFGARRSLSNAAAAMAASTPSFETSSSSRSSTLLTPGASSPMALRSPGSQTQGTSAPLVTPTKGRATRVLRHSPGASSQLASKVPPHSEMGRMVRVSSSALSRNANRKKNSLPTAGSEDGQEALAGSTIANSLAHAFSVRSVTSAGVTVGKGEAGERFEGQAKRKSGSKEPANRAQANSSAGPSAQAAGTSAATLQAGTNSRPSSPNTIKEEGVKRVNKGGLRGRLGAATNSEGNGQTQGSPPRNAKTRSLDATGARSLAALRSGAKTLNASSEADFKKKVANSKNAENALTGESAGSKKSRLTNAHPAPNRSSMNASLDDLPLALQVAHMDALPGKLQKSQGALKPRPTTARVTTPGSLKQSEKGAKKRPLPKGAQAAEADDNDALFNEMLMEVGLDPSEFSNQSSPQPKKRKVIGVAAVKKETTAAASSLAVKKREAKGRPSGGSGAGAGKDAVMGTVHVSSTTSIDAAHLVADFARASNSLGAESTTMAGRDTPTHNYLAATANVQETRPLITPDMKSQRNFVPVASNTNFVSLTFQPISQSSSSSGQLAQTLASSAITEQSGQMAVEALLQLRAARSTDASTPGAGSLSASSSGHPGLLGTGSMAASAASSVTNELEQQNSAPSSVLDQEGLARAGENNSRYSTSDSQSASRRMTKTKASLKKRPKVGQSGSPSGSPGMALRHSIDEDGHGDDISDSESRRPTSPLGDSDKNPRDMRHRKIPDRLRGTTFEDAGILQDAIRSSSLVGSPSNSPPGSPHKSLKTLGDQDLKAVNAEIDEDEEEEEEEEEGDYSDLDLTGEGDSSSFTHGPLEGTSPSSMHPHSITHTMSISMLHKPYTGAKRGPKPRTMPLPAKPGPGRPVKEKITKKKKKDKQEDPNNPDTPKAIRCWNLTELQHLREAVALYGTRWKDVCDWGLARGHFLAHRTPGACHLAYHRLKSSGRLSAGTTLVIKPKAKRGPKPKDEYSRAAQAALQTQTSATPFQLFAETSSAATSREALGSQKKLIRQRKLRSPLLTKTLPPMKLALPSDSNAVLNVRSPPLGQKSTSHYLQGAISSSSTNSINVKSTQQQVSQIHSSSSSADVKPSLVQSLSPRSSQQRTISVSQNITPHVTEASEQVSSVHAISPEAVSVALASSAPSPTQTSVSNVTVAQASSVANVNLNSAFTQEEGGSQNGSCSVSVSSSSSDSQPHLSITLPPHTRVSLPMPSLLSSPGTTVPLPAAASSALLSSLQQTTVTSLTTLAVTPVQNDVDAAHAHLEFSTLHNQSSSSSASTQVQSLSQSTSGVGGTQIQASAESPVSLPPPSTTQLHSPVQTQPQAVQAPATQAQGQNVVASSSSNAGSQATTEQLTNGRRGRPPGKTRGRGRPARDESDSEEEPGGGLLVAEDDSEDEDDDEGQSPHYFEL